MLLVILCLGILEIGRILDYEWMHRKFARADQQKKVRIYTHLLEEMQKLPAFLGISMSLGWKTGEVDQKIHEKYQRVEAVHIFAYVRFWKNLSMDSRIWSLMRCGQSLHL